MSQFVESPTRTFVSAAAIGQYLRVTASSSFAISLCGADAPGVGTTETPSFAASENQTVRLWTAQGTRKMVASGVIAAGGNVYAAASGKVASSGTLYLGRALEASAADGDIIEVMPSLPDLGAARVTRQRFTVAQVNAGATILTALPGLKYRVHDIALIAVGGAAATATTVDVLATQSASSVKLLAAAVAALTQNTLLRAGATNATILAAGASFAQNDANTDVTIGKTGSDVATATHIDVLLTYSIES